MINWIIQQWRWLTRNGWSLINTETIEITSMGGQRFYEIWHNDQTNEIRKVERDWT